MPFLEFSNVSEELLRDNLNEIMDAITDSLECPKDHVVISLNKAVNIIQPIPFLEVKMFRRTQEMKDKLALRLVSIFKNNGVADLEIAFSYYEKNDFYVDAKPLG